MYERSAIVLEKNFNTILGFDKKPNLKTIYKDYKEITEEIQKYQTILGEEDNIINEFDSVANQIRTIQQEQKKISKANTKYEEERNQLFNDLDENPETIEKKLIKIENNISEGNKRLEELRKDYIKAITDFAQKQQERNIYSKSRRTEERKHLQLIEKTTNDFNAIDKEILKEIKEFLNSEDDDIIKKDISDAMIENGKDERVPFNKEVIENAVNIRNKIEKKEAECYMSVYERTKRLLAEINNDDIKIEKYTKNLRDISLKLTFLKAIKLYIVSFLDNERMAAINGVKIHNKLMSEACENFKADIEQFENLYELILREIAGKSTKKAYRELYNKEYLKSIEDKEKNFEKELNNIKINAGALINSNYWRIEEIKNIYNIFQSEVSEKFGKDLSEFKLEENENNIISENKADIEDDIFKTKISDEDVEYVEEFEFDEYDEEHENDDDEEFEEYYDDDDDENDEEYDEYDEEYDDEYDEDYEEDYEDDYEDDEYDEDEYDDEDQEDYDEYDYDEDDEEYDDDNDDEIEIKEKIKKKSTQKTEKEDSKNERKGLFNKFFRDSKK